jgi:hypothetical protein
MFGRNASWWSVPALSLALLAPVLAQDPPAGGGGNGGGEQHRQRGDDDEHAPRRARRPIEFGPPPDGWQAPSNDGGNRRRRFLAEYTLPAASGQTDGPKVSVLGGGKNARTFDDYRARLRNNWVKADGSALAESDQTV